MTNPPDTDVTQSPEYQSVYKLAEIGCKIHAQHVDLVCRLTDRGICPRCLESLSTCGACHFQKQR